MILSASWVARSSRSHVQVLEHCCHVLLRCIGSMTMQSNFLIHGVPFPLVFRITCIVSSFVRLLIFSLVAISCSFRAVIYPSICEERPVFSQLWVACTFMSSSASRCNCTCFILPHFKMLMFQFVSDVGGTLFSDDNASSILNSFPSVKILSSSCSLTFAINMFLYFLVDGQLELYFWQCIHLQ